MKNNSLVSFMLIITFFSACSATTGSSPVNKTGVAGKEGAGNDMYYEYTITTTGKNMQISGDLKEYMSAKGNIRFERSMVTTYAGKKNTVSWIIIGNADKPDESIIIDDDQKTYTVNHTNKDDLQDPLKKKSTVSKIGEEKISGYKCVHARIISIGTLVNDTLDLWKSNDVPMQAYFKELSSSLESKTSNLLYSAEARQQLKQMGCDGFLVKLEIKGKSSGTKQELIKTEQKSFPDEMFRVPAGYKQSSDSL